MFETAIRNKYRFPSTVGMIGVEDLWDLSIEQLDNVYKSLKFELKEVTEDSLLITINEVDKEVQSKIDIVMYIFNTKLAEKEARVKSKERSEQKQYLLSILKEKQNDDLKGKSIDELKQMIDGL